VEASQIRFLTKFKQFSYRTIAWYMKLQTVLVMYITAPSRAYFDLPSIVQTILITMWEQRPIMKLKMYHLL
jgi:hypothetical protein